jgi:CDP-glucose 4,6-dehydratase
MENLVSLQQAGIYNNKNVFVTGHTGFKGSWLIAWLHTLGARVTGYALPPEYENSLYTLLPANTMYHSTMADIRNKEKLTAELLACQPDFVFHLAAQPLVRRSYQLPAETFEVNAVGTANLLEAVNTLEKKCTVIIITTDKVYENREQDILYKETDRLGGYDPYSASKACTEIVVSSFRKSFFNVAAYSQHHKTIASARAGNVIGGGDWSEDRIVPDIIRSLMQQKTVNVRNPGAVRPWQHVLEPLGGYLLLGGLLHSQGTQLSDAYNFGPQPQDHLPVKELVQHTLSYWGSGTWADTADSRQPHEANLLQLDISLAAAELHWQPKLTARQAIEWTVNWYKKPTAQQAAYTFEQIKNYMAL